MFMQRVQSKPILTTAYCSKPYSYNRDRHDHDSTNIERTEHVEEYVVMVNTRHQQVAQLFQEAYDRAKRFVEEGKKFRVKVRDLFFNLSHFIKHFFKCYVYCQESKYFHRYLHYAIQYLQVKRHLSKVQSLTGKIK